MILKRQWVMILIAVSSLLVAVAVLPVRAANQDGLRPSATPDGNILFQDDFETYSNRWTLPDSPKASVKYADGVLRARIMSPGVAVWSVPDFDLSLDDYRLEVDVEFLDGGENSSFGFVLDYVDDEHYYVVMTMLNGDWQFLHQDADEQVDLTLEDVEKVEFEPESSMVHLTAEMIDGSLELYLDDQLIGSLADTSLSGGLFGLFVQAGKEYADVAFDNLVVTDRTKAQ